MLYAFKGLNAKGTACTRVTDEDPESLAARLFMARWRELKVWALPDEESTVAEIGPDYKTGRRSWWAVEAQPVGMHDRSEDPDYSERDSEPETEARS